jgi:hypothetical protein
MQKEFSMSIFFNHFDYFSMWFKLISNLFSHKTQQKQIFKPTYFQLRFRINLYSIQKYPHSNLHLLFLVYGLMLLKAGFDFDFQTHPCSVEELFRLKLRLFFEIFFFIIKLNVQFYYHKNKYQNDGRQNDNDSIRDFY